MENINPSYLNAMDTTVKHSASTTSVSPSYRGSHEYNSYGNDGYRSFNTSRGDTDIFQHKDHNFMLKHMHCQSNLKVFLALFPLLPANYATLQDTLVHYMNSNVKRGFSAIFVVKQIIPLGIIFIMRMV